MDWGTDQRSGDEQAFMDTVFAVLARGLRRDVIQYLSCHPDATRREVEAALVDDRTTGGADGLRAARIEANLYHRDLPKLLESGVVRKDDESETMRLSWWANDFVVPLTSMGLTMDRPRPDHGAVPE